MINNPPIIKVIDPVQEQPRINTSPLYQRCVHNIEENMDTPGIIPFIKWAGYSIQELFLRRKSGDYTISFR